MRVLDSTSGSGNETYTFSDTTRTPNSICFVNDGASDTTLVVNDQTIVVKSGETLDVSFPVPFYSVSITTSGDWRLLIGD